jgi:hypothetical protein
MEQSRNRKLYVQKREHILVRKREWYAQNRERVNELSGNRRRASYAAAKAEGRCAFGSGYGCDKPARTGRVMCAEHQQVKNERNWVHTTESIWDSYFERGLTGDRCWLCGCEISTTDGINHDHLHPRSHGGPNELWNFAPAHQSCNLRRGNLPLEATLTAFPEYLPEALSAIPDECAVVPLSVQVQSTM